MPQVSLSQLADAIAQGPTLVSFPTDTVPALATQPAAAHLIYAAKGRPPTKPLILMGASWADLSPYVVGDAAAQRVWETVTRRHWPGQLTLVLPASERVPSTLNPTHSGTLGIRVPHHPIALALLARTGPLATTSANLSGQPPLVKPADIARVFPSALILADQKAGQKIGQHTTDKASRQPSGQPSTVAQWIKAPTPAEIDPMEEQGKTTPGETALGKTAPGETEPYEATGGYWKILRQGKVMLS